MHNMSHQNEKHHNEDSHHGDEAHGHEDEHAEHVLHQIHNRPYAAKATLRSFETIIIVELPLI